jgi:hypothetical protein
METSVVTREALDDEAARVREVRHLVDLATSLIMQAGMTRGEAEQLIVEVRQRILKLFPDGEQTYELVYSRRFRRLIDEFTQPTPAVRGGVIRFAARRP